MRMAAESGVISAVIWVSLSLWALTRMRYTPAWWLMLAIVLLSMLDHYTWRPHLMGFWFLALGILAVRRVLLPIVEKAGISHIREDVL